MVSAAGLLSFGLLALTSLVQAQIVTNPTFDSSLTGWTINPNTNGARWAWSGDQGGTAKDGTTVNTGETLSQILTTTTAGATYSVSFISLREGGADTGADWFFRFKVNSQEFTPASAAHPGGLSYPLLLNSYQTFTASFVAVGNDVLSFISYNQPSYNLLDNVVVTLSGPVPSNRRRAARSVPKGLCANPNEVACPATKWTADHKTLNQQTLMAYGWECVDVQSELESCGGCATLGQGKDCSKMGQMNRMTCLKGECVEL